MQDEKRKTGGSLDEIEIEMNEHGDGGGPPGTAGISGGGTTEKKELMQVMYGSHGGAINDNDDAANSVVSSDSRELNAGAEAGAGLATDGAPRDSRGGFLNDGGNGHDHNDNVLFYKVYRRRWFGLVQLTLLNVIVSWDVSQLSSFYSIMLLYYFLTLLYWFSFIFVYISPTFLFSRPPFYPALTIHHQNVITPAAPSTSFDSCPLLSRGLDLHRALV